MSDLYPTPTRLALLADIQAGKVIEDWYNDEPGIVWLNEYPGRRTRVTTRIAEMKQAEWCETHPDDDDLHIRRIRLKAAGEAAAARDNTTNHESE